MGASQRGKLSPVKPTRLTLDERMAQFRRNKNSTGVDWRAVSALSLRTALHTCLVEGAAVMFSSAAGGRGVCVTLFDDGDRTKEYVSTAEELVELLDNLSAAFGNSAEDVRQALAGGAD